MNVALVEDEEMTEPRRMTLEELLPGMQHAFFDTVWPAFRWIQSIWIKEGNGRFHLFVEAAAMQNKKEWDDFDYLAGKVFKAVERLLDELAPDVKHKIKHTIQYGPSVPKDRGYQELMSDGMFKKIAKEHAPWRLENGR
jgi:hypothetical protein